MVVNQQYKVQDFLKNECVGFGPDSYSLIHTSVHKTTKGLFKAKYPKVVKSLIALLDEQRNPQTKKTHDLFRP